MTGTAAILIVEDEAMIALMLQMELEEAGYKVIGTAATGVTAVAMYEAFTPDLILMDIRLADKVSGLQAAGQLRAAGRQVPIVFMTGWDITEQHATVESLKPCVILPKPLDMPGLRSAIASLLGPESGSDGRLLAG